MGKIFFTGDLHFGHANVIAFDNRPFKTVEEMDAELIRRWNNKVGKADLTYVLGDMIWKARNDDAPELIKSLNGQIILIKGNHDRFLLNAKAKAALAGIKDYDDICVSLEDGTKKRVIVLLMKQIGNKSYKVYYIAVINEAEAPISSIENNLNDLADLKPNQNSPRQRLTESLKKYDVKDSTEQPMFFDCIEVWNNYEFSLKI